MSWTTELRGYVKFLRGTSAAYAASNKDPETLYFIVDEGQNTGRLYLGSKLISTGSSSQIAGSLNDLSDISISSGGPSIESILVYNTENNKWEDKPLEYIANLISVMTGATDSTDGISGLIPAPVAGQQNLFLKGDGTWGDPTSNLTSVISTLVGNDTDKSVRIIAAEEVAKITTDAPEAFDTLVEIANWIQNNDYGSDVVTLQSDVGDLKSRVSTIESDLNTETTGLKAKVEVLVTNVGNLQSDLSALDTRVDDIEDNLKWREMVEVNNG